MPRKKKHPDPVKTVPTLRETTRSWRLGSVGADVDRTQGRISVYPIEGLFPRDFTLEEAEWAITLLLQAVEYLTGDVLEYPQLGNVFERESRADV